MAISALSAGAMLYVGLYQSRAVRHIWCPVFKHGCEAVADAAFAKPFGIPDGYIAAVLYGLVVGLLLVPERRGVWAGMVVLSGLAAVLNFLGIRDMAQLGSYCFYCILTTVLSPLLVWAVWRLR